MNVYIYTLLLDAQYSPILRPMLNYKAKSFSPKGPQATPVNIPADFLPADPFDEEVRVEVPGWRAERPFGSFYPRNRITRNSRARFSLPFAFPRRTRRRRVGVGIGYLLDGSVECRSSFLSLLVSLTRRSVTIGFRACR